MTEDNQVADSTEDGTVDTTVRRITQRGLYFDELEEGVVYEHRPGRTMTETDNVLFTTLTMNTQPLHLDHHWSASSEFGEPLINSMHTLATMVGLSVGQLTQGTIVANLGFSEVAFPAPVRHGDTIYCETRVTGRRASKSRPGQGIATFEHLARNQHGEVVAKAVRQVLLQQSPESAA
ncbi:MaoC family dehydratase [Agrococcus sp. ARC_14]|uniref:MaoC family dehydratase n=1 Tax=Agrococcus sp. ARC_14 TaxID=2919927 RepID=UPI001F051F6B|nr:MaoC family dehydratase [Agrococcus sp. ARC_14]MCH1883378.1 MaoC family dehydratase [Agrococcus sp. ARC_14]